MSLMNSGNIFNNAGHLDEKTGVHPPQKYMHFSQASTQDRSLLCPSPVNVHILFRMLCLLRAGPFGTVCFTILPGYRFISWLCYHFIPGYDLLLTSISCYSPYDSSEHFRFNEHFRFSVSTSYMKPRFRLSHTLPSTRCSLTAFGDQEASFISRQMGIPTLTRCSFATLARLPVLMVTCSLVYRRRGTRVGTRGIILAPISRREEKLTPAPRGNLAPGALREFASRVDREPE